ncbi:MAG TPA: glycoside hydrolase family 30 beta sandwich domain-containing protein [Cyclobacteriaceae bacterium]|nr:glycoside hydrolase family 30 beta sandwich domain-containing protein [Cyclobacteriaceae bacterium]
MVRKINGSVLLLLLVIAFSCGEDDDTSSANNTPSDAKKIIINPSITHQEMVGFGAALTWYSNRLASSSSKDAIAKLLFEDLGADIIRFKNWYYPDDYPTNKGTTSMSDDISGTMFISTNEIYDLVKSHDPTIKILLSSWGPPAGLKSNGSSREGTLKSDANGFMYDAFAQYWEDVLDYTPFNPDYISIQNEPGYINAGWTTCQWSATETASLPGYDIAFDKVHEKIQGRGNPPLMIGPESPDTNSFSSFAEALKGKSNLSMFAYHPYNINGSTPSAQISQDLQDIKSYDGKPNLMTEFSDNLSWLNTASFINSTLTEANSSGYIYWKMVWAPPLSSNPDVAMISIGQSGHYAVTPYYYLIKHFARDIDAGYQRIDATSENSSLLVSAFINPSQDKITIVVVNPGSKSDMDIGLAGGGAIESITVKQSKEGSLYKTLDNVSPDKAITLKGNPSLQLS